MMGRRLPAPPTLQEVLIIAGYTSAYLLKALVLGFSAGVMPGSFQAYLISQAVRRGWRRAAPLTLAPLLSDGPVIVVVLLLLSRLPPWSLEGLQLVGGLFVIYLGLEAWRAARAATDSVPTMPSAGALTLLRAATVNLLNPVVYVFWSTVSGPLLLEGWSRSPVLGIGFLCVFYTTMIVVSQVVIAVVSGVSNLRPAVARWMLIASAILLAALGLLQALAGLRSLGVLAV